MVLHIITMPRITQKAIGVLLISIASSDQLGQLLCEITFGTTCVLLAQWLTCLTRTVVVT